MIRLAFTSTHRPKRLRKESSETRPGFWAVAIDASTAAIFHARVGNILVVAHARHMRRSGALISRLEAVVSYAPDLMKPSLLRESSRNARNPKRFSEFKRNHATLSHFRTRASQGPQHRLILSAAQSLVHYIFSIGMRRKTGWGSSA